MDAIAINLISAVVIGVSFLFLNRKNERDLDKFISDQTLTMNVFFKYLGIGMMLFSVVILTIPFFYLNEKDILEMSMGMSVVGLIVGFSGIYFYQEFRNHKLIFNDKEIFVYNFRRKKKSIKWDELSKMSHNSTSGKITLTDSMGKALKINQFLSGISYFILLVETKTKVDVTKLKRQLRISD